MKTHASDDYEKIRDNLYEMLEDARDALNLAKEILRESEHPRAVEVYSGLLNNVVKLNSQILALSKTHKEIVERSNYKEAALEETKGDDDKPQPVYIGSTADLQNMLRDIRRQKANEDLIDVSPDGENED